VADPHYHFFRNPDVHDAAFSAAVGFHELGHAIVAMALPGIDPVQKESIIPRGIAALGYTMQVPTEDRFLMRKTKSTTTSN
jgi:ATP-dependent Zn protease